MIDQLELHHLRTLDVLYACSTLSAAAERLHLSQQAVSAKLQKMRAILGDELFVRDGHGMLPTAYALEIKPFVESTLGQLNAMPAAADFSGSSNLTQLHRSIVISATDYTQQIILIPLLAQLREAAPNVNVSVCNIEFAELPGKMRSGSVFVALTTSGYVPEGLQSLPLFTEQYRCVSANPALATTAPLSPEALAEHEFLVTNPIQGHLSGSADNWFIQQGKPRNVVMSVPSFFMAQRFLQRSHLVGFLPARLLPTTGLYDIPLTKYPPGYQVVAAWHPSITRDPLLRWLLNQCKLLLVETVTTEP